MKGSYVADAFSGSGALAKKVRAAGFTTREWGLLHGESQDITKIVVRRPILQDLKSGRSIGIMLAPPCSSW